MNIVFNILLVQIILGALDNFLHHELTEKLPRKRQARAEMLLHAIREFFYGVLFLALAWWTWHGIWSAVLFAVLILELIITIVDFVIEDRTRKLPAFERVLHTVLAINAGIFIAILTPILITWGQEPTALVATHYGAWSYALSVAAIGVGVWSVRDFVAAAHWYRPPLWQRRPVEKTRQGSAQNILVTGATGFIGTRLVRQLIRDGHDIIVWTRDPDKAWYQFGEQVRIETCLDEIANDEQIDAVVNLAGAPVAAFPWTAARRRTLINSRVKTTHTVGALIERLSTKPEVLINASAIGFYGVHGEKRLIEQDHRGSGFQADLCAEWEAAAQRYDTPITRVVLLRFGLVLGRDGGVLPQLARPMPFGLRVQFGPGRQWQSWIHIDDAIRLIQFSLNTKALRGPVNATAPRPVSHGELISTLAQHFRTLMTLTIPVWIMRRTVGELAELFVDGQKVVPLAAPALGFKFHFEKLHHALADLYGARPNKDNVRVFFDGSCPVCAAEIGHYAKAQSVDEPRVDFVDLSQRPQVLSACGLTASAARRRLYAMTEGNEYVSGADALIEVWRCTPGYQWLARVARAPGIYALMSFCYDVIAVPTLAAYRERRRPM